MQIATFCSNAKRKTLEDCQGVFRFGIGIGIGLIPFGNINGSRRARKWKQMAFVRQGECHAVICRPAAHQLFDLYWPLFNSKAVL